MKIKNKSSLRLSLSSTGFTIVELLIVIVVIGILATIIIVAYGSVQQNAAESVLRNDLRNAASELNLYSVKNGGYPSDTASANDGQGLSKSEGVTYQYTSDGSTYCLSATHAVTGTPGFHVESDDEVVEEGVCSGHAGPGEVINQGIVTTLAGSGYGHADGTGSGAGFEYPYGVAVHSSGNIYVADGSHTVRRVTPAGVVTTIAGSPGESGYIDDTGSSARFAYVYGIAIDGSGNLYVGDSDNNRIRKISSSGVVTTLAGSGSAGSTDGTGAAASFDSPRGVTVDGSGNVYVADNGNCRIRKITPSGGVTTLAGSTCGFLDATGTSARFSYVYDVAVDSEGNVYVADEGNHRIRKITSAGVVTTLAGSGVSGYANGSGTSAQFSWPTGLTVDGDGNVYVADAANERIRKITPAGVVTTVAGSTEGFTDGTGSAAQFTQPVDVTVSNSGVLYVADQNRIRKIE